jgi:hypothetical protein
MLTDAIESAWLGRCEEGALDDRPTVTSRSFARSYGIVRPKLGVLRTHLM